MELGEKIKKARLDAGMTQRELAGDQITRNMLSQIENGKSTPSVRTIHYLNERLGLPSGYFFTDGEDELSYRKSLYISDVKKEYMSANYERCFELCQANYTEQDDELLLILSECALRLGIRCYNEGRLDLALMYLSNAADFSEKCCYNTFSIKLTVSVYLDFIRDIGFVSDPSPSPATLYEHSAVFQSLFYHSIIKYIDSGNVDAAKVLLKTCLLTKKVYLLHIKAKLAIRANDYLSAIGHLRVILSDYNLGRIDAVVLFRIYSDLEFCYKEVEDYQNAYIYSGHKNTLLQKIKLPQGDMKPRNKERS